MPTAWEVLVKEHLFYAPETGIITWIKSGRGIKLGREAGCVQNGYRRIGVGRKLVASHKLAWFLYYDEWAKKEIDHIDRNPLNNRITNLRLATRQEQARNRRPHRKSFSSFRGVCREHKRDKWKASIRVDGKLINLGRFISIFDAAKAYDKAAIKHFGEYAYLNLLGKCL